MRNFEVHELVTGWTGQVGSLLEALDLRDRMYQQADQDGDHYEIKITAEVDERDVTSEEMQTLIRKAVAAVEAMTDEQIQAGHESGILDRRYQRPGRCQCSTCTPRCHACHRPL